MINKLILSLLFVLFTSFCFGQKSDYIFQQYTVSDGLPSNECYQVIQDSKGYIWIATDNGVARFDGYEFQRYGYEDGLGELVIFYIQEDIDGRIWMSGLNSEIYIYDPKTDRFSPYKYKYIIDELDVKNQIYSKFLVHDSGLVVENLWRGFLNISKEGELKIDSFNQGFSYYIKTSNDKSLLSYINYDDFFSFKNIHLLKDGNWFLIKDSLDIIESKYNYNRVYVSTYKNSHIVSISNILFTIENNSEISWWKNEDHINAIVRDNDQNPVICFKELNGVRKYSNLKSGKYETLLTDVSASYFLEDKESGYWITTTDKGLFYIKNKDIKYLSSHHQDQYYTHISQNNTGKIYSATYEGGLDEYEIGRKEFKPLFFDVGSEYRSLNYDEISEELWFSQTNYTQTINPATLKLTKF